MRDDLFLIDITFLLKASDVSFPGAPLLVDPEGGTTHTLLAWFGIF